MNQILTDLGYGGLIVLALSVPIVVSYLAFDLARQTRTIQRYWFLWVLGGIVTMTLGIGSLYLAAHIVPPTALSIPALQSLSRFWKILAVSLGTLLILTLGFFAFLFERQFTNQALQKQALEESETRFRLLTQEMQVGVLLLDRHAKILMHNQAALDLLDDPTCDCTNLVFGQNWQFFGENGIPISLDQLPIQQAIQQRQPIHDQVLGLQLSPSEKSSEPSSPAPPANPTQSSVNNLLQAQSPKITEVEGSDFFPNATRPKLSLSQRWLLVNADPQLDAQGRVKRVVCTLSDITAWKQAELSLMQVADQERAVARLIQQMRRTLDLEKIFQTTTQELRQTLGCDRVLVYQFQPDWSGILVQESVVLGWKNLTQGQDQEAEFTQVAVDAQNCIIRTIESDAEPLIEDTYLQRHQGGIYRQRKSYRCIPDIYKAGFSPCYIKLLEKLQARAYIIVPIFCGSQLWGLLACYQNGEPRQWQEPEIKMVGQISNQLGVAIQQAELFKRTQDQAIELIRAKETADAANRSKSEFLASMSHELRTPLNAILGFAQLMRRDQALKLQNRNYIEIINRSGEHLLELINDILEMSKIEAGRATLNPSNFDLHGLLDNLEDMLRLKALSKNLHLVFERNPELPRFIGTDKGKLRQVLINLLSNAIKFTEEGQVILRVQGLDDGPEDYHPENYRPEGPEIGTQGSNQCPPTLRLRFEVEDTGAGIAPTEIPLLFQLFTQTSSGLESGEGTGLGLPISYQFVELMGGKLAVKSALGQGSKFTFSIPVELSDDPTLVKEASSLSQIIGLAPAQAIPRILVVEDIAANRTFLVQLLQGIGFEVQEAENGQVAVERWQAWHPHLVLMDMRMPMMDGYEATRQIKALDYTARCLAADANSDPVQPGDPDSPKPTKIIALTASAFEEQRQQILAAGCDDMIRKPFQDTDLLQKIAEYLGIAYLYAETADTGLASGNGPRFEDHANTPTHLDQVGQQLAQMSAPWSQQVHHAAAQGSDELLLQLLEEIPAPCVQLREHLQQLVNEFRFDQVMELTHG
jgi:signal transduction histidine kinase/DNA-binding NarL/FixJ family response regulator/PAS domain-containing protein